jgi:hypothetical protein
LEVARRVAGELAAGANGAQILAGIAAIILGILASVGLDPLTLSLVGLLCLGAAVVFSGKALTSKIMTVLRRWADQQEMEVFCVILLLARVYLLCRPAGPGSRGGKFG